MSRSITITFTVKSCGECIYYEECSGMGHCDDWVRCKATGRTLTGSPSRISDTCPFLEHNKKPNEKDNGAGI